MAAVDRDCIVSAAAPNGDTVEIVAGEARGLVADTRVGQTGDPDRDYFWCAASSIGRATDS